MPTRYNYSIITHKKYERFKASCSSFDLKRPLLFGLLSASFDLRNCVGFVLCVESIWNRGSSVGIVTGLLAGCLRKRSLIPSMGGFTGFCTHTASNSISNGGDFLVSKVAGQ